MNVLIYSHAFAPRIGGAETFVMALARGLVERGKDSARLRDRASRSEEITVVTPTPAGDFEDRELPFQVVRQPAFPELFRLIRNADVIQLAGPALLPLFLGILLRKAVVVEHHEYSACCPNGQLYFEPSRSDCPGHFMARRYGKCLECNREQRGLPGSLRLLLLTFPRRWLCRLASANVPITDHVLFRLQLPRSRRIYYGIEPLMQSGRTHDGTPRPLVFAYVGRFVSNKGAALFLQAASIVKSAGHAFRVKMIGDGPERANLERLAAESHLTDTVTFTGFLQGADLQDALADVGAVIMPSLWQETAGLAAIEQMMRGRLVIASDIGGLSEVVGETGLRFMPGDAQELAACMERVIRHPEIISQLGVQARARALSHFRVERMIEGYGKLYGELLETRPFNKNQASRRDPAA